MRKDQNLSTKPSTARRPLRFAPWTASLLATIVTLATLLGTAMSTPSAAALDGEESAFLTMINNYRAQNGLGTLSTNGKLRDAGLWMAQDMAAKDYFSHTDSLGRDPFVRQGDFGYTYNTWKGENLAAGVADAAAAFELWKGSPGHNENMLNPHFTVIGIARAYGPSSTFGWYWSTEFGGQADPPPPAAPTAAPVAPPPTAAPVQPAAPAPATPAPTPVPATPTARPTASPTATPTPPPTPSPTPQEVVLMQSPSWWQIALEVKPWWDELTVVGYDETIGNDDSILTGASRMAEKFFEVTGNRFAGANYVHADDGAGETLSLSFN